MAVQTAKKTQREDRKKKNFFYSFIENPINQPPFDRKILLKKKRGRDVGKRGEEHFVQRSNAATNNRRKIIKRRLLFSFCETTM